MLEEEINQIRECANDFIHKNEEKYEIISNLQDLLLQLTEETVSKTIHLIENNKDIFFKDHESAIFFFYIIIQSARFNFKKYEIILDVCLHFAEDMKRLKTTEYELIRICNLFLNSIYYFYCKHFFSIESIIDQSNYNIYLFIYFLPEIEQYDLEYAQIREKKLFPDLNDTKMKNEISLYQEVKSNPENHILNRKINYHPSTLHKAIRDDDIDTFQSILSLNNIDVNHRIQFSYYERIMTHDFGNSLIQIAALYGSEKIFKYLWMNDNLHLDYNLLKYAYCGSNLNIIHLCEEKCSLKEIYTEPIATKKYDLLDYYIENYGDQIEEENNYLIGAKEIFKEDNFYSILNYDALLMAVYTFNWTIIKECLPKITYISRKVETVKQFPQTNISFLTQSQYNIDLFKFILEQKKGNFATNDAVIFVLRVCLFCCTNDAFKLLFKEFGVSEYCICEKFMLALKGNHDIANYLLDLEIENCESEDDLETFFDIYFSIDIFYIAIDYYNEDIFVKLVKTFPSKFAETNEHKLIDKLKNTISKKMIASLFNRISKIADESKINALKAAYDNEI